MRIAIVCMGLMLLAVACEPEPVVVSTVVPTAAPPTATPDVTAMTATVTAEVEAELATAEATALARPTPTPTPKPALGSRERPVPFGIGAEVRFDDTDHWEITVLAVVPDATELVHQENQFNDPPGDGNQFHIVTIRAKSSGRVRAPSATNPGSRPWATVVLCTRHMKTVAA